MIFKITKKSYVILLIFMLIFTNLITICPFGVKANQMMDDLPSYFCWKDINGTDFTTSVKNLYPAPTCEAYALCAVLETLIQYKIGYNFECDLSEMHLFYYPGGEVEWGVNLTHAADYLITHGVPDDGCYPDPHREYVSDDPNWMMPGRMKRPHAEPTESLCGWQNRSVKITEWGWVDNDIDAIKQALVEYGPLVVCILLRPNYCNYKRGIYKPKGEYIIGGHVSTLMGYDDNQRCWISKESLGTNWGEDGWIRIAYDAHNSEHPFFWPMYGGTGILYVDGIYGNLMPDVPKIKIEKPQIYKNYIFNFEIPRLKKKLPWEMDEIPKVIGKAEVIVNAFNTEKVEFYLDKELKFTDDKPPFEWELKAPFGLHTIETIAYKDQNISKDIRDVFVYSSIFNILR